MGKILEGIKVLDLSRVLAGPYCAQTLADLGADVTKVEAPWGDDTRSWGPPFATDFEGNKVAAYWLSVNRRKKIVNIDLKSEEGKQKVRKMIAESDVVVENFKPGKLEKLVGELPSDVIIASISAYGEDGPRRNEGGYDLAIQAQSGFMSITGENNGPPAKAGVDVIDVACGLHTVNGILAALFHKFRTGEVRNVKVSLWDAAIDLLVNQVHNVLASGKDPVRMGSAHPNLVPYRAFQAKDGWFVIAVGNDDQWAKLVNSLSLGDKTSDDWASNPGRISARDEIESLLADTVSDYTREELSDLLAQIPCSPVNTISEALADPQSVARGILTHYKGVQVLASPLRSLDD